MYHPVTNPAIRASEENLEQLSKAADAVQLLTILDPDAEAGNAQFLPNETRAAKEEEQCWYESKKQTAKYPPSVEVEKRSVDCKGEET